MVRTMSSAELNQVDTSVTGPAFARHETFHPRYGWLKKGFDAASTDPTIFNRDDAPVLLGVGKNMVRSIRYWCLAFKVLEEEKGKRGMVRPTEFGTLLLAEPCGLDPFMESTSTLWLLHWKLLAPPCQATAWHFVFNSFHRTEFTVSDLTSGLIDYVEEVFPRYRLAQSSVKKDVNCIVRMYGEPNDISMVKEETIDSPFTELGLIKRGLEKTQFRFSIGEKISLPDSVVVSSCLEYAGSLSREARTASLTNLAYSPGSPGQVFKLDEQSLYAAIERIAANFDDISLSETAGLIQLSFCDDPITLSDEILKVCYGGQLR